MNCIFLLLSILFVSDDVYGYNVLVVFPFPGKSHTILGEAYVRLLLKAGYEVTYITPAPLNPHPNLNQVDVSSNIEKFEIGKLPSITKKEISSRLIEVSGNQRTDKNLLVAFSASKSARMAKLNRWQKKLPAFRFSETSLSLDEISFIKLRVSRLQGRMVFTSNLETTRGKHLDIKLLLNREMNLNIVGDFYKRMFKVGNTSITHENVQKFLMESDEKFDLVIVETMYTELYCGFAAIFNAPYIWSTSIEPNPMIMTLIDEIHNPAYAPDDMSHVVPPLNFLQRIKELWHVLSLYYNKWLLKDDYEKAFRDAFGPAAAKRGITLPLLEELKHNSSLIISNSHVSSGIALRYPQNFIPVAGYHIEDDIKPLPEKFKKIMDSSTNGVIYFSLGTMMPSTTMPEGLKIGLLKMFSELKQTIIWKLEEEFTDLPKNVHIVQWAPQQSILSHPNCILFITHGGLLSTTETIHFGVPIIGIPLFADQFVNVARAVIKGYALHVDLAYDMPETLKVAIDEMLGNSKYREKVKELSFIYHHRPVKPAVELIHWVEHVIRTRGSHHLRSPAFYVPFYQRLFIDLIVVILIAFLALYLLLIRFLSKKESKEDDSKKRL